MDEVHTDGISISHYHCLNAGAEMNGGNEMKKQTGVWSNNTRKEVRTGIDFLCDGLVLRCG